MTTTDEAPYITDEAEGNDWRLLLGDSCERMAEVDDESVDLSIFSPPFSSLYTYSPSIRDLGNCTDDEQFAEHFGFVIEHLHRATKPGRLTLVHLSQLASTKAVHGVTALRDFRGLVIKAFGERGWLYHGEVLIDKDPQAQAIRTHSQALLFVQLRRDSTMSRPALADYVLMFRKPGDNAVPVLPDIDNEQWIEWAKPVWYGIKETATLNVAVAREDADERHICPLQLPLIERCIRLWSNPGETVLSPFAGIGSECYTAVKLGRRAVGIELKPSYWKVACDNLRRAEYESSLPTLFDGAEEAGG